MTDGQHHLAHITKSLKTSSAVVPAILLTLICLPTGAAAAHYTEPPLQYLFVFLAVIPPVLAVIQIIFFTIYDRDRLQNEEHVERKMLIGQMRPTFGDAKSTVELAHDQVLIGNPAMGARDV